MSGSANEGVNVLIQLLSFCVYWVVVPGILFGIVLFGRLILRHGGTGDRRISLRAGFWGGLVLFVVYLVYELPSFQPPRFTQVIVFRVSFWEFGLGSVAGFLLLFVLRNAIKTAVASGIVLMLTFAGSASLYGYFFIQTSNDTLLSVTLGVAFGTLVHVMVAPQSVHELFGESPSSTTDAAPS